jgi:signal transduction histidine kinase
MQVIPYLTELGRALEQERQVALKELELVRDHVGHIKQIVSTQQSYAKVSGVIELTSLAGLAEHALQIVAPGLERHGIRLETDFEPLPEVGADKHQILQILLNLLRNAKEAIKEDGDGRRLIGLRIHRLGNDRVRFEVKDSGVGLDQEQLTRIFAHGYTTKRGGHGFGLHSGALAAKQMGGSLRAESDGRGRGATFILELPWGQELERRAG